jgi:hypothetical protein
MDIADEIRGLIADWRSRYKDMSYSFVSAEESARIDGKEDAYGAAADELEALLRRFTNKSANSVLEEARDRLMSLEADPDALKVELRPAFRGGFSQCRHKSAALLNEMITDLKGEK